MTTLSMLQWLGTISIYKEKQMKNTTWNLLAATSKNTTFDSDSIDVRDDLIASFHVITTSQSSLNVSIQLKGSLDGSNWVNIGSPTAVTTNTTSHFAVADNPYSYLKLTSTFSAGSATFSIWAHTKSV